MLTAIAAWARLCCGSMERTPDHKAHGKGGRRAPVLTRPLSLRGRPAAPVTSLQTLAGTAGPGLLRRVFDSGRGTIDVRVVAFPQDGILRDPGAEAYVREALAMGADVGGGISWIERMMTTLGARVLRLQDYGLAVGRAAHLIVLRGHSVHEALRRHAPPRYVVSHGRLVAETSDATRVHV